MNHSEAAASAEKIHLIQPISGWRMSDIRELTEYRDLFVFLVWRDIKVLYAQTVLGFSWALIQPLTQIVIFTVVFGRIAQVNTEGIPYFLYSTVAIIPWTYVSQAVQQSSASLVTYQSVLDKIYFPRILFPLTPIAARLVDFMISILILIAVGIFYQVRPTWNLIYFPVFLLLMMLIPTSIGLWLSALAIRFRDVKHALPFVVRMLIYTAPIVYSAASIPEHYRMLYSLNPLVGLIEGFRACLLGTPIPWVYIWPGVCVAFGLLALGAWHFKRMEQIFVDVI